MYIISKQDALLAIYNFSELKSLANNAKIRYLLKIYTYTVISIICRIEILGTGIQVKGAIILLIRFFKLVSFSNHLFVPFTFLINI